MLNKALQFRCKNRFNARYNAQMGDHAGIITSDFEFALNDPNWKCYIILFMIKKNRGRIFFHTRIIDTGHDL